MNKNDDTLIEENFCHVKILYKQRIFENIIKECNESTSEYNYLKALIYTCEELPIELLSLYLTKVSNN